MSKLAELRERLRHTIALTENIRGLLMAAALTDRETVRVLGDVADEILGDNAEARAAFLKSLVAYLTPDGEPDTDPEGGG